MELRNLYHVVNTSEAGSLRDLSKFLVGPAEIAESLSIDANTINVWRRRESVGFPEPVRHLKRGPVWDIREIREWAIRTGRTSPASLDISWRP